MTHSNHSIAAAFVRHDRYRISARNLWYDGKGVIYSYRVPIASFTGSGSPLAKSNASEEAARGHCLVGAFTARGGKFVSKTTSRHVNLVKRYLNSFAIPYKEIDGDNFNTRLERRRIAERVATAMAYKRDLSWTKREA